MRKTILIVDDIKANRLILSGMLGRDYDILEAVNGEDALTVLGLEGGQISAVLLDIGMPVMDGFEALHRIREDLRLAQLPVIMITGSEDEDSRVLALAQGASDYVTKPYNAEIIRHCLRNHISFHEAAKTVNALKRDSLTTLYTRETFFDKVRDMVDAHESGYYVMACFDINRFKIINDQYGTEKGDDVLRHAANVFRGGFNPIGGVCSRISADDFAVLYPKAYMDSDEVRRIREEAAFVDGVAFPVTFSIGRYIIDDKTLSPSAMYDRAALAAVSVKARFDSNIALYDEAMRERVVREQEIVSEMKSALAEGQFEAWFQPQYNHATGARIGAEALVRWRHPRRGLIPPGQFIPIFEQNGFIYELDKYIWDQVCRYLRKWIDQGSDPLPVSVNISRNDILNANLQEVITGLIKKYDLPAELLRLEVTESAFSMDTERVVAAVTGLVESGFTVEIDDFGSGYSSLNTLKDVPAQILKLDMRFLEKSSNTERSGSIIESVIRMARWLGMSVVAEGVEEKKQADFLLTIGCNYIQGYLYAKPMPADEYEAHCIGVNKEERLLSIETVENLDSNSFWDPQSIDTLIFSSFVGAASVFEYHNGRIELIRATELFVKMLSDSVTVDEVLRIDWTQRLDAESRDRATKAIAQSADTKLPVPGEYVFLDLPGCPRETHLRSTIRVIATAGDRQLVYCTNENITSQRAAEREVHSFAQRMQSVMDSIISGICATVVSGEKVRYLFTNDRYYEIHGYTREQFDAEVKNAYDLIHPEDRQRVKITVNSANIVGKTTSIEYRAICRDGIQRWVMAYISVHLFDDVDGPVQVTVVRDITEEKKNELKLQALSVSLQNMMDDTPGGFARMRVQPDGRVATVFVNEPFCQMRGMSFETICAADGADAMISVHPDDRHMVREAVDGLLRDGSIYYIQYRLLHNNNEYIPVNVRGRMSRDADGGVYINAYFTELSAQEKRVYDQRDMVRWIISAIMEESNDYAFAKDKDFRYTCCSPAFLRLAGLKSAEEVQGKTDYELFPVEMAEQFRKNDLQLIADGRPMVDFNETVYGEDGSAHYCRASKHILRDASGELLGLYGVSRDVSAERTTFEQLRLITDSIPGGIARYELTPKSIRIVYYNDGYCHMLGCTRMEYELLEGDGVTRRVHTSDLPQLMRQFNDLMAVGTPIDCTYRSRKLDGSGYVWVNIHGVLSERRGDSCFVNAVLYDITKQQNMLEQLRISEEESALAVRHGGSLVCRYDVANKTLTISDETAAEVGLPPVLTDVPEEPVRIGMISPETVSAYKGFFEAIQKGNQSGTVLYQQRYFNTWKWTEAKSTTIFSDEGAPVKAVISMFDVTDRVEKETIYKKWQQSLTGRAQESYTLFRFNVNSRDTYDSKEGGLLSFDFDGAVRNNEEAAEAYAAACIFEPDRDKYLAFVNSDAMLASYYRGRRSDALDYRERLADGEYRWLRLSVDLVEYPNSTDVEAYMMYEDIDTEKRAELQTIELAETDPLTGILNRTAFAVKVNGILSASKPEVKHALMMLDLDGFKRVNDVFGHAAGDQILIDIARGLNGMIREEDMAARLGGDEFMVFLNNVRDESDAVKKAMQICEMAHRQLSVEVEISSSVGVVIAPRHGRDFDTLYKKADAALYYVKGSGKNNAAVYREAMADEHLTPEEDSAAEGAPASEKKRRMLIVDDNSIDVMMLNNIFKDDFIIDQARDGASALIRLQHYGDAISVVLLDLMMPVMDGFTMLKKLQESPETSCVPVIVVSGDNSREAGLRAIRQGASDFVTKPVDPDLLRIRVRSAISKAENERLRAKNIRLQADSAERAEYEMLLECSGIAFIWYDRYTGEFSYHPGVSRCLLGDYDDRGLWKILLSDAVADDATVQAMRELVYSVAEDVRRSGASMTVCLKTPREESHRFLMNVLKSSADRRSTGRLVISFSDLDYSAQ